MRGAYPAAIAALCCVMASPVAAQPPVGGTALPPTPAARPDLYVSVGWLNVNKDELGTGNNWFNRGVDAGVTFGWHWTPHLKTEIDASASRRGTFYSSGDIWIDGRPAYGSSDNAFSTRRVAVGQQYQFGENAWFHPHLGAGVEFNWETVDRFDHPVFFYTASGRQDLRGPIRHPRRTDVHVRPFAEWGFKAYMTGRAFFRSDLRVVAAKRPEEVRIRFGFGMDF